MKPDVYTKLILTLFAGLITTGVLIGASILMQPLMNPYRIEIVNSPEVGPVGWRLNTHTGAVDICKFTENPFDQFDGPAGSGPEPGREGVVECSPELLWGDQ